MIDEIKEAYETGKSHARAKLVSILKNVDMDKFITEEQFNKFEFNKWLDSLNIKNENI